MSGHFVVRAEDHVSVTQGSAERLIFGDYWVATGFPRPGSSRSVAVAEMSVEFVTTKKLAGTDGRGLAEYRMKYPQELLERLPMTLNALFEEQLEARGLTLTPRSSITSAPAFASYPKGALESLYEPPRPIGGGGASSTTLRSATSSKPLGGVATDPVLVSSDRALAAELGVGRVIRFRARVGVYRGRATLEIGSVLVGTSGQESGTLASKRALASARSVLRSGGDAPNDAGVYEIDTERYLQAVESLFRSYARLATEAID